MEKEGKFKVFDDDTLSFLEKVSNGEKFVASNAAVVAEAPKYHVNLDELEQVSFDASPEVEYTPHNEHFESPDEEEEHLSGNIDVKLKDVVNRLFQNSDRPIIIVKDDKIDFANKSFVRFVGIKNYKDVQDKVFLNFVLKDDWNLLADHLGDMLTKGKVISVRIKIGNKSYHKMNFSALYVHDDEHFTFVLVGDKVLNKSNMISGLYDTVTGLPSFYLLEDRVQVAVNSENYKDYRLKKNPIVLVGVAIDNIDEFMKQGVSDFILKKIAARLSMSLKRTYTVASGVKYHFWVLMTDLESKNILNLEIAKIIELMREPVNGEFTEYDLVTSIGVSLFPDPAPTSKKLLEQTVLALQKALKEKDPQKKVVIFGE